LISSYFTVWQRDISFPLVSSIMTVVLSLPALIGIIKWLEFRKALIIFVVLGVFAYIIEAIGIITHFPYGNFNYNDNVGLLIFDFIPLTLPFAWIPLLIGSIALSLKYKNNVFKFYASTILWLIGIDLVLDPGAVYLRFWQYMSKGIWYGVPISNYFGWVLSGTIGFLILIYLIKNQKKSPPTYIAYSYFMSLIFWSGVCFFSQIWGGFIVGVILLFYILKQHASYLSSKAEY